MIGSFRQSVAKVFKAGLLHLVSITAVASPLFDHDSVIDLELIGQFSSLKRSLGELPFVLKSNGMEHTVALRTRGKSRQRVCRFPPLRLNFNSRDTSNSIFEGLDKIKLVTHCRNRRDADTNVLEEYAAYRIFNLISKVSYRVRLLHITYTDTEKEKGDRSQIHYAFLIEPSDELAARSQGQVLDVPGVSLASLSKEQINWVYVFQYMIGNTDWSLVMQEGEKNCCHNGDLFLLDLEYFYVPFDFDLAGLVNAAYAYPHPSLGLNKVTTRRYRGFCGSAVDLHDAIVYINSLKTEILKVPESLETLLLGDASTMQKYLGRYFEAAEDPEKLIHTFEKRCL
jgi:hypothetical protein